LFSGSSGLALRDPIFTANGFGGPDIDIGILGNVSENLGVFFSPYHYGYGVPVGGEGYVLAVDIGTSSIKVGLVDTANLSVRFSVSERASFKAPRPGWAEIDPEDLWASVSRLVSEVAGPHYSLIRCVVVSGHMAGIIPVDRYTLFAC